MIRSTIIAFAIAAVVVATSLLDDAVECSAQVKQQMIPHCGYLMSYLTGPNAYAE
jgi:hypothetical protein